MGDEYEDIELTHGSLYGYLGRSKATLSAWCKELQLDPFSDAFLTGSWVGRKSGRDRRYRTTRRELHLLKQLLRLIEHHSRRVRVEPWPAHLKLGSSRGNENVTVDDLLTRDVLLEKLGPCKLLWRNRAWLDVVDAAGRPHKVKATPSDLRNLRGVPEFFPFESARAALESFGWRKYGWGRPKRRRWRR
jgi:hypothetical protein